MTAARLCSKPEIGKSDFVHLDETIFAPGFLGICIDNYRNRPTRMCDVYGFFHEAGSVYAYQMKKLDVDRDEFKRCLAELYKDIEKETSRPPDWKPEDLDGNLFLKSMK